ncbi:MAG: hypothetical protein RL417_1628 [Pseudomonadota bacterium]
MMFRNSLIWLFFIVSSAGCSVVSETGIAVEGLLDPSGGEQVHTRESIESPPPCGLRHGRGCLYRC